MKHQGSLKILVTVCCFLTGSSVSSQDYTWSTDSISRADPNFAMDRYHDILRYHDPYMYLVVPVISPLKKRKLELQNGEGSRGHWLEGNFAYRFIFYKGKYYSTTFLQRTRFTLDVGLTSRVTRDESSPLLPLNNKFCRGFDLLLSKV